MTITQLEYIIALDEHRHFAIAAEKCFVTQPTLSMQIQKLEEELGVKLFDRTKQPVIPTDIGLEVLQQARKVILEANQIKQIIAAKQNTVTGELKIGIIPTLAPYLLPQLYKQFIKAYPQLHLVIKELITEDIISDLKQNKLDCGIVVTPLNDASIQESPLFYEELFVYVSKHHQLYNKKYILPKELEPKDLWFLEEGHCFRSQVLNLCELKKQHDIPVKYESGNIETLKRMVDYSDGITILPELAVRELSKQQMQSVKPLKQPAPVREVSLVTHRSYVKSKLIQSLKEEILKIVPRHMKNSVLQKRILSIS